MRILVLIALLEVSFALAQNATTDLWNLLGNSKSPLGGGDVVYRLADGRTSVEVGATFGESKGDGYTELELTAFKFTGSFTEAELRPFGTNITNLAMQCFNADPSRSPAIVAWIIQNDAIEASFYQTSSGGVRQIASRNFGPLQLNLDKRVNGQGHTVTVYMSRQGTPGEMPWMKNCIASG